MDVPSIWLLAFLVIGLLSFGLAGLLLFAWYIRSRNTFASSAGTHLTTVGRIRGPTFVKMMVVLLMIGLALVVLITTYYLGKLNLDVLGIMMATRGSTAELIGLAFAILLALMTTAVLYSSFVTPAEGGIGYTVVKKITWLLSLAVVFINYLYSGACSLASTIRPVDAISNRTAETRSATLALGA